MSTTNASVLVAGGAVTVLLLPMLATILGSSSDPGADISTTEVPR
jgi:hypothetical protein